MTRKEKLERILSRGKGRYIVQYGVIGWGITTAALFSAWNWYIHGRPKPVEIVVSFIVFPLGGILWGNVMWGLIKNQYEKLKRGNDEANRS